MVELLRLDERLIHGQVATKWVKAYPIDSLLVVDDEVVKDVMSMKTLQLAAMSLENIKTFFKNTEDALKILQDPRCKTRKVMVVARNLDIVLRLAKEAPDVQEINLGNYGRMTQSTLPRQRYFDCLALNEEEVRLAKKISELGIICYYQSTTDTGKTNLVNYFKKID
jgi:mannose/fructose/N-acetylgalactosamine-specific phosphotransferase system component IIB